MRAVIQRVSKAKVKVEGKAVGKIDQGLLVLLGITHTDDEKIIKWMSDKIQNLRIFNDDLDKKNASVKDISGSILVVSNFTIYGELRKGSRPNFGAAAPAEFAEDIYNKMIEHMRKSIPLKIETGIFGAMMEIELVNDGPVTIIIEKENVI
jgi:D-tyrosyl-tRNA(Tyr) deacylase